MGGSTVVDLATEDGNKVENVEVGLVGRSLPMPGGAAIQVGSVTWANIR